MLLVKIYPRRQIFSAIMQPCFLHTLVAVLLAGSGSYAAAGAGGGGTAAPKPSVLLPSVLSSNMVLPAAPEMAKIWGWSSTPGEKVTVAIQFGNGSTARLPTVVSNSTTGRFAVAFSAAASLSGANITINNDVPVTSPPTHVGFG